MPYAKRRIAIDRKRQYSLAFTGIHWHQARPPSPVATSSTCHLRFAATSAMRPSTSPQHAPHSFHVNDANDRATLAICPQLLHFHRVLRPHRHPTPLGLHLVLQTLLISAVGPHLVIVCNLPLLFSHPCGPPPRPTQTISPSVNSISSPRPYLFYHDNASLVRPPPRTWCRSQPLYTTV